TNTALSLHDALPILLLLWCRAERLRPTWSQIRASIVIGVFFFLIGHGSLHWAEQKVPSGLASLLIASEARPEGTFCSAQCNEPWPMRKKKTPMTILARICDQVGRRRSARHQRRRRIGRASWRDKAVLV